MSLAWNGKKMLLKTGNKIRFWTIRIANRVQHLAIVIHRESSHSREDFLPQPSQPSHRQKRNVAVLWRFFFLPRRKTTFLASPTQWNRGEKISFGKRRNPRDEPRRRRQPMRRRQATGESDRTSQPKERTPKRNLWTSLLLVAHQRQAEKEQI